jgi:hypothetical protein
VYGVNLVNLVKLDDMAEITLSDVQDRHPRWHVWTGVTGIFYARRPLTSPPRVVRGSSPAELDEAITLDDKEHPALQW